jgi:hypothetical protein
VNAIAQRFGISRRTVFRVLAKAKQQATGNKEQGTKAKLDVARKVCTTG